jgi:hypothetical protein
VGVEPTGDGVTRRPPVLKTGTITGPHALPQDCREFSEIRTEPSTPEGDAGIRSIRVDLAIETRFRPPISAAARFSDMVWVTSSRRDTSVALPRSILTAE